MIGKTILTRVVMITAAVAVASLGIAALIGFAVGGFHPARFGGTGMAVDERKSLPLDGVAEIAITAVSEDIRIVEGTGDSVEAWYHGTVGTSRSDAVPRLVAERRGSTAELRVERNRPMSIGFFWSDLSLEVKVPKGYAQKLSAKTVSGNIDVADHGYAGLALSTTSGDMRIGAVSAAGFSAHTVSGELLAASVASQASDITSVSGDVDVKSITGDMTVHTTSGEVTLGFAATPARFDGESTSGDIMIRLPRDAQFTLDARSTSGEVVCRFPITISESRKGGGSHVLSGAVGAGAGAVSVRTVSGEIRIEP